MLSKPSNRSHAELEREATGHPNAEIRVRAQRELARRAEQRRLYASRMQRHGTAGER